MSDLNALDALDRLRQHVPPPSPTARANLRERLLASATDLRRARHQRRTLLAAAAVAVALTLAWRWRPAPTTPPVAPLQLAHVDFQRVPHDVARVATWRRRDADRGAMQFVDYAPSRSRVPALAAWRVRTQAAPAARVDDAELLRLLAEAARPTGLVRSARGVFLTAAVVDRVSDGP